MKVSFSVAELEHIASKSGWMNPRLGGACLSHALRNGADVAATVEAWRKNQSGMFYPHRRTK